MAKIKVLDSLNLGCGAVYKTLYAEKLVDAVGECDPNLKQIRLELGHPKEELLWTYLHEVLHAGNFELELGLTENQVLGIEWTLRKAFGKAAGPRPRGRV